MTRTGTSPDGVLQNAPSTKYPWFRTYRSDLVNFALQQLPDSIRVIYHDLRCVADHAEGRLPCAKEVAWLIRKPSKRIAEAIEQLVDAGLLREQDGFFFLTEWVQSTGDFSAERTKLWRDRNRKSETSREASQAEARVTSHETMPVTSRETERVDEDQSRVELSDLSIARRPFERKAQKVVRSLLDPEVQPSQKDREAADEYGLSQADFRTEWGHFRDYHVAHGKQMADWHRAWRNWLTNHRKGTFAPRSGSSNGKESPFVTAARSLLSELSEGDRAFPESSSLSFRTEASPVVLPDPCQDDLHHLH